LLLGRHPHQPRPLCHALCLPLDHETQRHEGLGNTQL
jgi:hypothetical protein